MQRNSLYCILPPSKRCPQFLFYTEKQMVTEYTNLYSILYTISQFLLINQDSFQYLTQWKNVFISNLIAKLQSNRDKLLMQVLDRPTRADAQLMCCSEASRTWLGMCDTQWQPWLQRPQTEVVTSLKGSEEAAKQSTDPGLWKS